MDQRNNVASFTCCEVSPFTIPIDSGGLSLGLQIEVVEKN